MLSDFLEIKNIIETNLANLINVLLHFQVFVEYDTQIADSDMGGTERP